MLTRRRELFSTVRTEGALLPPDLLQRVAAGDRELEGLTPEAYHLAANERLGEAVTRSWNRLVGAWVGFRESLAKLPEADLATSLTRERWLLILFQELGYGRLPTARAVELDGKSYAVSHAWGSVPIHLVGARVPLDRRTAGVAGAAGQSPHGLLQELLNRSDERLWGFVSNGLVLRVLRDNSSLTRQAFVEFDLEAMLDGEVYSDFVVLWLLCHQSRVEGERPAQSWLERWSQLAAERGTRALESLRAGVEEAIAALGRGFLAHPLNRPLRDALRAGNLSRDEYYRQLLRLVYRLLFLFVAEDRELLLDPDASPEARDRYARFFSTQRLRRLAQRRRGAKHSDLYDWLRLVMRKLGEDDGCPALGLPALGSFLWSADSMPNLDDSQLANEQLLEAVRALTLIEERGVRRAVDYKNLGSEELGSVYESLLELHPEVNIDAPSFELRVAAGHERKTTGSYYTPSSLISVLLDSALDPVLDEAARAADPEHAILALTVCDPACGSGHFLVAAAHRIAKRLAGVRTGDEEPAPQATRRALRDVVGRCLYGVDVNPMAVELCKVALWMEALDPGRPLSFLDSHIKCGNSLLGATPQLIAAGIPDGAFKAIEGDDAELVSGLRRSNRQEREGQLSLEEEIERLEASLVESATLVEAAPDDSLQAVHAKEARFRELGASLAYELAKSVADAWCAAFVIPKRIGSPEVTSATLRRLARGAVTDSAQQIAGAAAEFRFFHWHVEFPTVFSGTTPGFHCVLGNPPWQKSEFSDVAFFAERAPSIAQAAGAKRKRLIGQLEETDEALHHEFIAARRGVEAENHFVRASGRFPLCGRGRLNTYALFAELMRSLQSGKSRVGCIVPLGIATDDSTKHFFSRVVRDRSLVSLFGFENEEFVFPAIHHATKFCLLTIAGSSYGIDEAEFIFFARSTAALADEYRRFTLSPDDFALLNPNTRTCPIFRTRRDAELTKAVYRRVPVLLRKDGTGSNPWEFTFKQGLFNMTADSGAFETQDELELAGWRLNGTRFVRGDDVVVPLYEAKMIHHFDHRFGTYARQTEAQARQGKLPELNDSEHLDPELLPLPRYWVSSSEVEARYGNWANGWVVGFRDITSAVVLRTVIATVLPRLGMGNKLPLILTLRPAEEAACLVADMSSFAHDYIARQKIGGTSLNFFILEQLPIIPPATYHGPSRWSSELLRDWILPRVLELVYTAWDLEEFARDLRYGGPPFRWDAERRALLRAELDAAYFHLYGHGRDDVAYIIDTFWVVRDRDVRDHGEYRTKQLILECYDAMDEAIQTRQQYETALNPPPADARVAHTPRSAPSRDGLVIPLPFHRLAEPPATEEVGDSAPIYTLRAAAGTFGHGEAVHPDGWAVLHGQRRVRPGMFVAQVCGRSMEPRIPDGTWCLFTTPVEGSRDGRILLVEHRAIDDPDNGGSYTVKRYRSRKRAVDGELWEHDEIVLEPLNPEYEPIVLSGVEDGEVRVVAELVDVLG
jgi:hypothetical protein